MYIKIRTARGERREARGVWDEYIKIVKLKCIKYPYISISKAESTQQHTVYIVCKSHYRIYRYGNTKLTQFIKKIYNRNIHTATATAIADFHPLRCSAAALLEAQASGIAVAIAPAVGRP